MKSTVCANCRHKIYTIFYTPKFCRNCGGENLTTNSYLEWLVAALTLTLAFYFSLR